MADEKDLERLLAGDVDLSRSDLRKANLSNMDLRGRDFSGALLERADLRGSDLRDCNLIGSTFTGCNAENVNLQGVKINSVLVAVNVAGSNLRGTDFSHCRMQNISFSGADISGASFAGAHFGEDVVFDDVKFDSGTDFEGAEGLRYLSRLPAFSGYAYEQGKFRRLKENGTSDALERTKQQIDSGSGHLEHTRSTARASRPNVSVIQARIAASPNEVQAMAINLAVVVKAHLDFIASRKPNDPESLTAFDEQTRILLAIEAGLNEIARILNNQSGSASVQPSGKEFNRAARIVADLSDGIEKSLNKNSSKWFEHAVNAGLIGAASVFFSFCGAPAAVGFATAAALIGGKAVIDRASSLLKPEKKK
ncbi:pentapeptide repeat-containing protein [Boseaceae bacterium BT-24-1]|nr:pentapeptide repeat-containing protein [Boseaceae bacterium BT-24-1]